MYMTRNVTTSAAAAVEPLRLGWELREAHHPEGARERQGKCGCTGGGRDGQPPAPAASEQVVRGDELRHPSARARQNGKEKPMTEQAAAVHTGTKQPRASVEKL